MGWIDRQFAALGRNEPPPSVLLEGEEYALEQVFTHNFFAAVALYARGEQRIVCKFHRTAGFFGIPLGWLGRLAARYECAVLERARGVRGVPALLGRPLPTVVARRFVPGRPLERGSRVSDEFFSEFLDLLRSLHQRDLAYVDLEKAPNILLGDDGHPHLIDFQTAFYIPPKFLGRTALARLLRRHFQRADLYHAMKHWRRCRPDQLTEEQIAASYRKPWTVRVGNVLHAPFKTLRRWILARRRRARTADR